MLRTTNPKPHGSYLRRRFEAKGGNYRTANKAYFGKAVRWIVVACLRANEDEGLSLDAMAEILSGYGYPVHEGGNSPYDSTNGSYSPNAS